jgi:phosphoglycerate dehydrogenase-like enzyme
MKAVLPYDASPGTKRLLESLDPAIARVTVLAESDSAGLAREIADADVLLHVLAPVTAAILDAAPKLRLVQKIGIGVDAIDRVHAAKRGVAVCNMPGTNTVAVAELTLALMLAALRRVTALDAGFRAGDWTPESTHLDAIGYGAVAKRLRTVLEALGTRVVVHARRVPDDGAKSLPLDVLLSQADVVSLHVPATAETRGLLSASRIARMKKGAVLVNTARGALVDEPALVAALRDGHLAAAGLDVFAIEPPSRDNALLKLPNVVATPHIAWMTPGTWRRSLAIVAENCRRLASGSPLLHRVDPP